jgi:hypothetical protein
VRAGAAEQGGEGDEAEPEKVVIARHGRSAEFVIGVGSVEDWFDYRLETMLWSG